MNKPLVSVIMPAYRCAATVGAAIDSVLCQDVDLELLVIDDCSPESLEEALAPYSTNPRVRLLKNEQNMGAAQTRNRGVSLAKGEYVAFLDSDDIWLPGKLQKQLKLMEELHIPLYLEPQPDYTYIYELLKEFPNLTVVLCNIGIWPSARLIYPLLKRYPNVYFESGDLGMTHGYEQVCEYFGSERLLYGTNFPSNNPGCSMNCLLTAKLSEQDRDNIAYKNMERLLGEVKL